MQTQRDKIFYDNPTKFVKLYTCLQQIVNKRPNVEMIMIRTKHLKTFINGGCGQPDAVERGLHSIGGRSRVVRRNRQQLHAVRLQRRQCQQSSDDSS